MKQLKQIYPDKRMFRILLILSAIFFTGYYISFMLILGKIFLIIYITLIFTELILLFRGSLSCKRNIKERLSNGDENTVGLILNSSYPFSVRCMIIEELPEQFQERNFRISLKIKGYSQQEKCYSLVPLKRGRYDFGYTRLFIGILSGSLSRRISASKPISVSVYPSYFQLRKTELMEFSGMHKFPGIKKIRLAGSTKEFEEIKDYVPGDNYRWINWKATARRRKLMVNQYQDERSRDVYQLIDMGRSMKMPFEGMTLLDYSINSCLAISNVILKKHDRTGLITYSTHIHSFIKANNQRKQLNKLLEALYAQKTRFPESNLEHVYQQLAVSTQGRSLIIIYTNYESNIALERQLPLLKKIAAKHLILLVTFINTEILKVSHKKAYAIEDVYTKAIATKQLVDKQIFLKKLSLLGIGNISVKPADLTLSVLNKYLEIKQKGF